MKTVVQPVFIIAKATYHGNSVRGGKGLEEIQALILIMACPDNKTI